MTWRRFLIVSLCLAATLATAHRAGAAGQDEPAETKTAEPDSPLSAQELELRNRLKSPRDTLVTFAQAMEAQDLALARECLELSWLASETTVTKGNSYAVKLSQVLKELWDGRPDRLSDDPQAPSPFALASGLSPFLDPERLADARQIELIPDAQGRWRFRRATLEKVEAELWEKWQAARDNRADTETALSLPVWIESRFPKALRTTHFLLKDYQWICLLSLIAIGFLVGRAVRGILDRLTDLWFKVVRAQVDDRPRLALWRPVGLVAHALTWYVGAKLIDLPPDVLNVLLLALKFFTVVSAVWLAFRAIDLLSNYLSKRALATATRFDDTIVPLIGAALKALSIAGGILLFADVFELDWKAVMGGFGVGGIALAIASKDMIGNVFGSVTVLTDRPFEIGDWVVVDGKVEGTVEAVGMRSTRVRTFYNSEVTVPNSLVATAVVDNMGRRSMRRLKTLLSLQYDTPPDLIEAYCAGVREILRRNPHTRDDNFHVYLYQLSESSVDVLVYAFLECPTWGLELEQRHRLLCDFLKLAETMQVSFAFPTRTLQLHQPREGAAPIPALSDALQGLGMPAAGPLAAG